MALIDCHYIMLNPAVIREHPNSLITDRCGVERRTWERVREREKEGEREKERGRKGKTKMTQYQIDRDWTSFLSTFETVLNRVNPASKSPILTKHRKDRGRGGLNCTMSRLYLSTERKKYILIMQEFPRSVDICIMTSASPSIHMMINPTHDHFKCMFVIVVWILYPLI